MKTEDTAKETSILFWTFFKTQILQKSFNLFLIGILTHSNLA